MLDGEMTMKTEEGERLVRRGETVHLPGRGRRARTASATTARGAAGIWWPLPAGVPEVGEYPELGQITRDWAATPLADG